MICIHGTPAGAYCMHCMGRNCIHGTPDHVFCEKCIDIKIEEDKHKKLKPTSEEIISLLKNMIQLNGTLLELMSELMHKVRNIEHAIKEGLIKESNKSEHQDGDSSRQTAEASGSDSSVNSRQESEASGEEESEEEKLNKLFPSINY